MTVTKTEHICPNANCGYRGYLQVTGGSAAETGIVCAAFLLLCFVLSELGPLARSVGLFLVYLFCIGLVPYLVIRRRKVICPRCGNRVHT